MFRRLFSNAVVEHPRDGRPVYAIGDIHGRADLLDPLLEVIFKDAAGRPGVLVTLGDYVDRGQDSRAVIERLSLGAFPTGFETVFLKGNHEAAMLDFLERPEAGPAWVQHGGLETLLSYGVRPPTVSTDSEGWRATSEALRANLPETHISWLNALRLWHRHDGYFFVHAGVDKDRGPRDQDEATLLWTRRRFLSDRRRWPFTVVHGHTPEARPVVERGRIGIDTGAYATGVLTAVRLERTKINFFSAKAGRRRVSA
ncbi:MAG: metallophosphoesterase [Oceanicaulis sp.]